MSRKFIEVVTSDLSGDEDAEAVTVPGFTIDLTAKEREGLFTFLEPYLAKGVKTSGNKGPKVPQPVAAKTYATRADKAQSRAQREWLTGHGYELSDRGRIPLDMQAAYESRTPAPGWKAGAQQRHQDTTVTDVYLAQAEADAELDKAEKTRGASTRKPPTKAAQKAAAPPAVPQATFTSPSGEGGGGGNVTAIKPGRTGARSSNATTTTASTRTTGGRVAAAAKSTAAKKTTSAKVARS